MEFLAFHFLPVPFWPVTGHSWEAWHCLLYSPSQTFSHIDKILLNLLFYRLNSTITLSSCVRCLSPLMIFAALHWNCSRTSNFLALGSPALETVIQVCQQCWAVGKDHLPRLADSVIPNAAHVIVLLCWKGTLLVRVHLSVQQHLRSFSGKGISDWTTPAPLPVCGSMFPRCTSLNFCLDFLLLLLAHFFNLQRSLWMMMQPSGLSTLPSSFVSPVNLLKIHWVPWPTS